MKLKPNSYYWVRTVTIFRGNKTDPEREESGPLIAYYDGTDYMPWMLIGSDWNYETYTSDDKIVNCDTHVIPIELIVEPDGEGRPPVFIE